MNKNYYGVFIIPLFVMGCSSTQQSQSPNAAVTPQKFNSPHFAELHRFPARYPESAVVNALEGCATLEYVVTPVNEVTEIQVIATTEQQFAIEAAKVIPKWQWSALPKGMRNEALKIQTRFEFCLEQPNQRCEAKAATSSCPGEDVIISKGVRLR